MICFKDIQPTWNILEFDKGLDCTPTTTLSRYGKDPLDLDTAICFSFSGIDEEKEQIFYYLHTDITVNSKSYSSNSLVELFKSREPEIHAMNYLCSLVLTSDDQISAYKKAKTSEIQGFRCVSKPRRRRDSNPRAPEGKRISSAPRYDRLNTSQNNKSYFNQSLTF